MHFASLDAFRCHVVTHRATLDQITVIDQHTVFDFGASLFDKRGGARQANLIGGFIFVVVIIHQIGMNIRGFNNT
ncbi:Uncharacterised protein [Vibrio cholerae]|nr:Uncharacterised protein [Vibrio cholerae]CSB14062.1 Uncharacterised protein [Vibrio cholerae]